MICYGKLCTLEECLTFSIESMLNVNPNNNDNNNNTNNDTNLYIGYNTSTNTAVISCVLVNLRRNPRFCSVFQIAGKISTTMLVIYIKNMTK